MRHIVLVGLCSILVHCHVNEVVKAVNIVNVRLFRSWSNRETVSVESKGF
jgi:hypothetical protein